MAPDTRIAPEDAGQRLDRWYRRRIGPISQSRLERLCRQGRIRVDAKRVKCATRLESGQKIRLPPGCMVDGAPQAPGLSTAARRSLEGLLTNPLYEDDHLIAINKPAGLATQGGRGQHIHLDLLLAQTGTGGRDPFRLIHRLDRQTSGVLLLGKTLPVVQAMGEMFRARSVRKDYLAVTILPPHPRQASIAIHLKTQDRHHGVTWQNRADLTPRAGEKSALTYYRVLQTSDAGPALVALSPQTGRKHQLRAHLAAICCPVIGDTRYGLSRERRQAMPWHLELDMTLHLHALSLGLTHPITRRYLVIKAPLPRHMLQACKVFGWPEDYGPDDHAAIPSGLGVMP